MSMLLNICAFIILIFLVYLSFTGLWLLINLMGKYEYGEGAKLITVIVYHIVYYWILFSPIQILIATMVSVFLRKKRHIALSILIQILPFIILFFVIMIHDYLI